MYMIFIWVVREQFTSNKLHLRMRATIVRALFYEKITLRMQSADTQSRLDRLWNAYMCSMWYVIFFILMIQHWERCILKWTFCQNSLARIFVLFTLRFKSVRHGLPFLSVSSYNRDMFWDWWKLVCFIEEDMLLTCLFFLLCTTINCCNQHKWRCMTTYTSKYMSAT